MDNRVYIESSVLQDIFILAPILRQEDKNEVSALNLTPQSALLRGFVYSDECYTVKYRNQPIGMFGVSKYDMPDRFASIWFLGSDECTNHPFTFVKQGINFTNKCLQKYDILINAVDSRNKSHIAWLKKIGMTISSPIFINGFKFLQFYKHSPSLLLEL